MFKLLTWSFLAITVVLEITHGLINNSPKELLAGAVVCGTCTLICFLVYAFSSKEGDACEDFDYQYEFETSGSEKSRSREIRRKYGDSAADLESYR